MIRTRITGDPESVVECVIKSFRDRDVGFLWVDHPSATPTNLGDLLAAHGVPLVEHAIGMSIDLAAEPPLPDLERVAFREVLDDQSIREYADLVFSY